MNKHDSCLSILKNFLYFYISVDEHPTKWKYLLRIHIHTRHSYYYSQINFPSHKLLRLDNKLPKLIFVSL
jgi:hypothetical protein